MESYYDVLGVSSNASDTDIKKAYRKLSYEYHPDKNQGDAKKTELFKKVSSAYETLQDPVKRQQYDFEQQMCGYGTRNTQINHEMNDIMEHLMGSFAKMGGAKARTRSSHSSNDPLMHLFQGMGGMPDMEEVVFMQVPPPTPHSARSSARSQAPPPPPEDIQHTQEITYEEAFEGCCVPVSIKRHIQKGHKTQEEEETLYVDIPKGVDNNEIITLKEKGNIIDQAQSDLKIHVLLKPHKTFQRQGLDLLLTHMITFKESMLGFSFVIPHMSGSQLRFNHARGKVISNKMKKQIKGLGFQRGDTKGDLVLEFLVEMPESLTEEQLEWVEKHF